MAKYILGKPQIIGDFLNQRANVWVKRSKKILERVKRYDSTRSNKHCEL